MTDTPAKAVRAAWAGGRAARNAWLTIPDTHLAEMVAARGTTEAVTLDLQHGMFDHGSALSAIRAVSAYGLAPMIRLPGIDSALIGHLLDAGAAGVIAPMVESVGDAEALVSACRYPPLGRRSHGPIRTVLGKGGDGFAAAEQAVVFAMIETATGLERCEEIAKVPGLDGLFIGPGDLGLSMGLGIGQDRTEPELTAAFARILAASRAAGGHAGMHAATTAYADKMAGEGFDLVTVWVDAVAVGTTLTAADATWREARG
jgi:4-hydroxy-2-oxoheptanedioate aldolase